jgi:hypothetical protein
MSNNKKSSSEGYAIAALVIGSLALMLFWLPYIGFGFAVLSLIFAAVGLVISLDQNKKSILVYIAIGLALLDVTLAGNITLKTNDIIHNLTNDTKFLFKKHINTNTKITRDSNKIHILIEDNNSNDSLNIEFENLEQIMESFDDTLNIQIHK